MMRIISMLLLISTLLMSCSDNDSDDVNPSEKPVLPPASSMAPDLSAFEEDADGNDRIATIENWTYAALNVGVYSKVLFTHLTVPVTAFKLAIKQEATFDSETRLWVWQYDVELPQAGSYHVELTADVDEGEVTWTGYISQEGIFEDFVWFEGTSKVDATSGKWTLYQNPQTPSAWLSSEWSATDSTATALFTVEKDGAHKDSSISYEVNSEEDLDRSVIISDTNLESEVFVEWSSTTYYGRVKSEAHFGDANFRCWDENLQNADCE